MQAPFNNLIVKLTTKYTGAFTAILKESQIAHNTEFNAADLVQIVGTVVSVPKRIQSTPDYKGFTQKNILPGDKIIMRYDVVYAFNTFSDGRPPQFKNCFWYKGAEYWSVDIQKVFAVIRGEQIIMQNGYCMVENIEMPTTLIIPQEMKRVLNVAKATLTQIDYMRDGYPPVKAERMDTVYLNPAIVQKYRINKFNFGIVDQKHIMASDPPIYE